MATSKKAAETKEAVKETAKKTTAAAKKTVKSAAKTVAEAKTEVKKATEEVKTEVKKATKEVKTEVKKATEEVKAEAKKRAARKPAKTVMIQYMGMEINEADLTERALAQFAAVSEEAVKKIALYIKPEDGAAYYVINDAHTGCVKF